MKHRAVLLEGSAGYGKKILSAHIVVADKKYHLGVSDLSRIQPIKLGWMEEVLIKPRV